jgi:hypothetical protein
MYSSLLTVPNFFFAKKQQQAEQSLSQQSQQSQSQSQWMTKGFKHPKVHIEASHVVRLPHQQRKHPQQLQQLHEEQHHPQQQQQQHQHHEDTFVIFSQLHP